MKSSAIALGKERAATLIVLISAPLVGYAVAVSNNLLILLVMGLLCLTLILLDSAWGIVLAWGTFFLVPYGVLRTPIPFMTSPVMAVASAGIGVGILRIVTKRTELPKSIVYPPMVVWAGVLLFYAAIGYGSEARTVMQWTLQGMWAFVLVILLIRTPRQAKYSLWALSVFTVIGLREAIPAIIGTQALAFGRDVSASALRSTTNVGFHAPTIAALVWPVLYGLTVSGGVPLSWRLPAAIGSAFILAAVVSSGFGTPVVTLIIGATTCSVICIIQSRGSRRLAIAFLGLVALLILLGSGGTQAQLSRILSGTDASVSVRIAALEPGIRAFLAQPITGWGVYGRSDVPQGAPEFLGHNSLLQVAVPYGLLGLVPVLWLFAAIGLNLFRLGRKAAQPVDKALVAGMQATYIAYVAQGLFSVSLGILTWDSVFWFFIGLSILWLQWLKDDVHSHLA